MAAAQLSPSTPSPRPTRAGPPAAESVPKGPEPSAPTPRPPSRQDSDESLMRAAVDALERLTDDEVNSFAACHAIDLTNVSSVEDAATIFKAAGILDDLQQYSDDVNARGLALADADVGAGAAPTRGQPVAARAMSPAAAPAAAGAGREPPSLGQPASDASELARLRQQVEQLASRLTATQRALPQQTFTIDENVLRHLALSGPEPGERDLVEVAAKFDSPSARDLLPLHPPSLRASSVVARVPPALVATATELQWCQRHLITLMHGILAMVAAVTTENDTQRFTQLAGDALRFGRAAVGEISESMRRFVLQQLASASFAAEYVRQEPAPYYGQVAPPLWRDEDRSSLKRRVSENRAVGPPPQQQQQHGFAGGQRQQQQQQQQRAGGFQRNRAQGQARAGGFKRLKAATAGEQPSI